MAQPYNPNTYSTHVGVSGLRFQASGFAGASRFQGLKGLGLTTERPSRYFQNYQDLPCTLHCSVLSSIVV